MITKPFSARLSNSMDAVSSYLPLRPEDESRLQSLIPEDEYTFLTIKNDLDAEYVKVTNQCGVLLVERGQGGTAPVKHPRGSCVFFENSVAVTEWLICNFDCCAGDCPCEPVTVAGVVIPPARVGVPWGGSVIFGGDLPMVVGASTSAPSWLTITAGPNYVVFEGTPPGEGTFVFSASATNCAGSAVATTPVTLTVA